MIKIPINHQSDQNISKPLKWPQYRWNIHNDKNKLETYQITKIPLKPPKQLKYPQNDKHDQNTLENKNTLETTKIPRG